MVCFKDVQMRCVDGLGFVYVGKVFQTKLQSFLFSANWFFLTFCCPCLTHYIVVKKLERIVFSSCQCRRTTVAGEITGGEKMANFQDASLVHSGQNIAGLVQNPGANAPKTIRLMDLMECLIQRAYHELVVLAEVELISRSKNDFDKKVAIINYLSRTRNYFVRFVALLEWSSSMAKVSGKSVV